MLAGDHKQLSPTVMSTDSDVVSHLSSTLFERLIKTFGQTHSSMLNVQYRMNEKIIKFSNDVMYDGKLLSGEDNQNIALSDFKN
mmetsp:Transcript_237/g.195  ORF Transcript_237/g.195 Transcript_237/m.195 type:complete len:84 (-) Transcript_237:104-355(-)